MSPATNMTHLPELALAVAVFLRQVRQLCLQLVSLHLQFLALPLAVLYIRSLLLVGVRPRPADQFVRVLLYVVQVRLQLTDDVVLLSDLSDRDSHSAMYIEYVSEIKGSRNKRCIFTSLIITNII